LARAFNKRTKAIIINNPNNPTSRVFTLDELQFIASLCQKWGTLAICDEIYEHMVWDGRRHVMFSTLPGMEERTFTCSGLSKTYNVTGWRVGWVIAPAVYTEALRRVHDYLTLSAPTPFQYAGICALESPPQFYDDLVSEHTALRDRLAGHLQAAGFNFLLPQGSYFFFADCSPFGFEDDRQLAQYFAEVLKVIAVPGSAFYQPGQNTNLVRFCFAKPLEMLDLAGERLLALASRVKN
jgi:aminotransferase